MWTDIVEIAAFCASIAGFILFFVCYWRRMRVAWQRPHPAKPKPTESTGELLGYAIGFFASAIGFGGHLTDQVQHGAAVRLITLLIVVCASAMFVSGLSFGRLSERLAVRRQQRLGDGDVTPHGEAAQS